MATPAEAFAQRRAALAELDRLMTISSRLAAHGVEDHLVEIAVLRRRALELQPPEADDSPSS